jgi:hypothetical protein
MEQLYTFADRDRTGDSAAWRAISISYLGLTREMRKGEAAWRSWYRYFPWEDHRAGRPPSIDGLIAPRLLHWAETDAASRRARQQRIAMTFGLDGSGWNEELVLQRYELLYEAGLAREAARDRGEAATALTRALAAALGEPMLSDHRRILATAVSRLRGKLKYRPVVFELMPEAFTLSALQRAVEAIAGVPLHKQNFRRALERAELVEGLGRMDAETGGRPAELFRFRREILSARPVSGLSLPLLRD